MSGRYFRSLTVKCMPLAGAMGITVPPVTPPLAAPPPVMSPRSPHATCHVPTGRTATCHVPTAAPRYLSRPHWPHRHLSRPDCAPPSLLPFVDGEVHAVGGRYGDRLGVAVQVDFESKYRRRYLISRFQALSSRRFQRGFDRVNLHRPTLVCFLPLSALADQGRTLVHFSS